MTLQPCDGLWGSATVIDSDPACETIRDAVYLPLHPSIFLDAYNGWGIYHRDGSLAEACAYYRLQSKALIGQCRHLEVPPSVATAPPGSYVYGGPVIMHYGHFLTAALPRLWQIVRRGLPQDARIVCHSHQTPEEWFKRDYARAILTQLGLTPDHFVQFAGPTLIPRLHAPRPALEEQNFAHRVFRDLCLSIGRPFQAAPQGGRIVYLSKTRTKNGTYRLMNEEPIEDAMRANGIEVAHPETLPFAGQVSLLASSAVVIGTVGSAFHTSIFCERPPRMIGLAYGPVLNSNYALVDALAGSQAQYFHSGEVAESASGAATFCYEARDPAAVAQALIRSI